MALSNYPPGVTGMEWQIAGDDELELQIDCKDGMLFEITLHNHEIGKIMNSKTVKEIHSTMEQLLLNVDEKPCNAKGVWAMAMINRYDVKIECPECGHDYYYDVDGFFEQYEKNSVFECRINK
jgi:hypothetical protein